MNLLDTGTQDECAEMLGEKWKCEIRSFGGMQEVDWYAVRDERMVAVLELKCRDHTHDEFDTVFLSFRKWVSLWMAYQGFGVKPFFVVRFLDGIYAICLADLDISQLKVQMGGRKDRQWRNDWEPLLHVPVEKMTKVLDCGTD